MNNMNDIEKLKMEIAMFNATEDIKEKSNMTLLKNEKKRWGNLMKKKIIATACAGLILVSGIVVASNINKYKQVEKELAGRQVLGEGIKTAIYNGYISYPKIDFMDFDDKGTQIKIESFLMDDLNLSINFLIKFDESKINMKKISEIDLNKLVIRDEENKIMVAACDPEFLEKYYKENNLNYKYDDYYNDNIMYCGLLGSGESKEGNMLRLTHNMYLGIDGFPKSKKLYFSLGGMKIREFENGTESEYELEGNWNVEVDVPENMYNRTNEEYKVVNCSSKNFNVYKTILTDTRFEIGFTVSNTFVSKGGYIGSSSIYIINEYRNKFNTSYTAARIENAEYSDDEMKCDNYKTFEMTKYDATDKIYIIINYYGVPVFIELERVK